VQYIYELLHGLKQLEKCPFDTLVLVFRYKNTMSSVPLSPSDSRGKKQTLISQFVKIPNTSKSSKKHLHIAAFFLVVVALFRVLCSYSLFCSTPLHRFHYLFLFASFWNLVTMDAFRFQHCTGWYVARIQIGKDIPNRLQCL
jgi:hypothetical protein